MCLPPPFQPLRTFVFCLALGLAAVPLPLRAQEAAPPAGRLEIELNKFEQAGSGACRAFFLFRNRTGNSFEAFEMSLAIFRNDGVIDRLLTIDAAPLPVARTTLKLFEIQDTRCSDIHEILLHEISACKIPNQDDPDCFALIALASRTPAQLVQ